MKQRILLALLRTPLWLLMHLARWTLALCAFLWRQLDRFESLEGLSVRQIMTRTGLKHYEAYERWKELNPGKARPKEPELEIYQDGKPLPSSAPASPFALRTL